MLVSNPAENKMENSSYVPCPYCGKPAHWIQQHNSHYCSNCKTRISDMEKHLQKLERMQTYPWFQSLTFQEREFIINYFANTKDLFKPTRAFNVRFGNYGNLVITNHRVLFTCKIGLLATDYTVTYAVNLEDIALANSGKSDNNKLIILEKSGRGRVFLPHDSQIAVSIINNAISNRQAELQAQREKEADNH